MNEREVGNYFAFAYLLMSSKRHLHAGNDIKIIPSGLMYLGRFDKNVALSFICSITS